MGSTRPDGTPLLMVLGTQGWIPGPHRATTCLAYREGDALLVFDAGTGLARFLDEPARALLDGVATVHLFLTHYHLDHSCGLSYLSGIFPHRRVTIHVPDEAVNGVPPQSGAPTLIRPPFFPEALNDQADVDLVTLPAGRSVIAGLPVDMRPQHHSDISVAYRVGDRFVLATDTVADAGTAQFARGAEVLLHEAWIDGEEEDDPRQRAVVQRTYTSHSSARQAARLAADAAVRDLYLIHLNPLFDEAYYRHMERAARRIFPSASVPADLFEHRFAEPPLSAGPAPG